MYEAKFEEEEKKKKIRKQMRYKGCIVAKV